MAKKTSSTPPRSKGRAAPVLPSSEVGIVDAAPGIDAQELRELLPLADPAPLEYEFETEITLSSDEPEIERLLPTSVIAGLDRQPAEVFQTHEMVCLDDRPGVIGLDARDATPEKVIAWLAGFDVAMNDQFENAPAAPYLPHRVVFLTAAPTAEVYAPWRMRPDITWMEASRQVVDLDELYRQQPRQTLASLGGANRLQLRSQPSPDAVDAEQLLPPQMREAWRARMDELKRWGDVDESEVGS